MRQSSIEMNELSIGTSDLWNQLGLELQGQKTFDEPRVSKKVMVKALKMNLSAIQELSKEFTLVLHRLQMMEEEAQINKKKMENMDNQVYVLSSLLNEANAKIQSHLEDQHKFKNVQQEAIQQQDVPQAQLLSVLLEQELHTSNNSKIRNDDDSNILTATFNEHYLSLSQQLEKELKETQAKVMNKVDRNYKELFSFMKQLEERLDKYKDDMILSSRQIRVGDRTLTSVLEDSNKETQRCQKMVVEAEASLLQQTKDIQDMLLLSRRTIDDNTNAVEHVQRTLLGKADRLQMNEIIDTRYQEIIEQLQKALSSVNEDEGEFKRVSQELQDLIQHLSTSKADKKELLEIKEHVLYDARVREKVENLRAFMDLKMNKEDAVAILENKANREDMENLLKSLSDSMNASVQRAVENMQTDSDMGLLRKKKGTMNKISGEKDRCLSCNSKIQTHCKEPVLTPGKSSYGGGFQLHSPYQRIGQLQQLSSDIPTVKIIEESRSSSSTSKSNGLLVGVDGIVYHGESSQQSHVYPDQKLFLQRRKKKVALTDIHPM